MGQLVHRACGQPTAPVKELALLIGRFFPQARGVIEHATVQFDIMAARNNLQRVELQILHVPHGRGGAYAATPTPSRPQALFTKDKAPSNVEVDG